MKKASEPSAAALQKRVGAGDRLGDRDRLGAVEGDRTGTLQCVAAISGGGGGTGEWDSSRPPIIQHWHNQEIPESIRASLATFGDRNPELLHLGFNENTALELISEHYGARHAEAFRACAVPAMQADYFRYCGVHALGGVYADANFQCHLRKPYLESGSHWAHWDGPVFRPAESSASP